MSNGNLDLIRGAYEAFSRGDIPSVLAILSDDVQWTVPPPLPQAVEARGPDQVGAFFERLGAIWEGLDLDLDDFVASGNRVCVIGRGSGRVGGREAGYGFVHAWTVENDRAVRFDEYSQPGPGLL
jgi:ketosteroid isomerase-like protein